MSQIDIAPEAQVDTKRGFSIIWVVPIIAVIIGGMLAFKAIQEKGPTITITFETAEGLEAGKTLIKYKDVEVGKVTAIDLMEDISGVIVTAEMTKDAEPYMTENSRFWVVRARVAAGEVTGLGTLFSGAYIGVDPSLQGKPQREFTGLEKPPLLTENLPGRHFVLESDNLGSLDLGSPVYYRGIKVGKVVEYGFDTLAESVLVTIFINAPYHEKVFVNTRFWNASGIDLTLDATGVNLNTESLLSIMLGGVSFDLRDFDLPGEIATDNKIFVLYPDKESSKEEVYTYKHYYLMYFDQSVRGLSKGAPVEIKGIQVGEVVDIKLEFVMDTLEYRIPVLVVLEPERLNTYVTESGEKLTGQEKILHLATEAGELEDRAQAMIDKGFRAQLKTGNLLTGQLFIDLDHYPDAPPALFREEGGYPVFPTIPSPLEQIVERVDGILKKVERIPFGQIGQDLQVAIAELTKTLNEIKNLSGNINQETVPRVNATLDDLQKTLKGLEETVGPDSALTYNARVVTKELSMVIRSIRSLLEYLERDPQALLLGKEGDK